MDECSKCGAPARHSAPDGDFRYVPPIRESVNKTMLDALIAADLALTQKGREGTILLMGIRAAIAEARNFTP